MCGIAGIVETHGREPDLDALQRMVELIRYRGPDAQATHVSGPCALGHARLSIVDLATGQQPMSNGDGRLWLVFNGEIYNHVELRAALEAKGHRFRTRSDTEVILHLYEEYGEACVERMNGQWAFALWDERRQQLFMARDQPGIAPLFYAQHEGRLLFGSEMKSILGFPDFPRRIDPRALDNLMTTWSVVPPRGLFEGVVELPPGHMLTFRDGQVTVRRYFELAYDEIDEATPGPELCERVLAELVDAARLRFQRSDVPVGAYLSGGLDSTLIASIVRRFTDVPLRTFSVRFEDAEFDEGRYQDEARSYLGVEHQELMCRKDDIARHFPDVIWHAERSVVRTAPAPMYLLSGLVRDAGYKVVLTGEGADEMFGGYDIFKEAKVRRWIAQKPGSRLRPLLLRRLYPYLPQLQRQSPASTCDLNRYLYGRLCYRLSFNLFLTSGLLYLQLQTNRLQERHFKRLK
jgi:asparagine synthase (glutamine-hydrolysing)